jgi:hypothetical protein
MAGLSQDQRDFLASWLTKKYEADWAKFTNNQQWTGLSAADQASLELSRDTLSFQKEDAQRAYELALQQLQQASMAPTGNAYYGIDPSRRT